MPCLLPGWIDLRVKDGSGRPAESSGLAGGVRSLAFYLPQYHPIPENDEWWGVGFTEWRNVIRAKPLFKGHYQPHLPADLGFYDLRVPETREAQADLARTYGITGFCYYHYWFNGRLLLNRPFDEVLSTGRPEFPFCLCWANENWTRRWDGREQDVLLGQQYSLEDDLAHIEHLLPAFADDRYVKSTAGPCSSYTGPATYQIRFRRRTYGEMHVAVPASRTSIWSGWKAMVLRSIPRASASTPRWSSPRTGIGCRLRSVGGTPGMQWHVSTTSSRR